jgi:hypothetical protein
MQSWEIDKLKPGSRFAVTDHGGMTKELFNALLKDHIGPWLIANGQPGTKVILMDGDGSHEPHLQTIQWLMDHNMELARLPANLTQFLCPLDVNVFGPLKWHYHDRMRRALHAGAVLISIADRRRLMDEALSHISPMIVMEGWRKSSLYPLDDDMWKREAWAELSAPFAASTKQADGSRRSLRLQLQALERDLQDTTMPLEQKLDHVRQCARANPSYEDIARTALPRRQASTGTHPRRRVRNSEMTILTTDEGKRDAGERDAKAEAKKQQAARRSRKRETLSKVKQLVQAAEEASARMETCKAADALGASQSIEAARAAKHLAAEAVRTHEAQGSGKTYALKANRVIKRADRHIQALEARIKDGVWPLAKDNSANIGADADAAKENETLATTTSATGFNSTQGLRRSAASPTPRAAQRRTTIVMLRA